MLRTDFTDPRRGFGLFTFVVATDVLGAPFMVDGNRPMMLGGSPQLRV